MAGKHLRDVREVGMAMTSPDSRFIIGAFTRTFRQKVPAFQWVRQPRSVDCVPNQEPRQRAGENAADERDEGCRRHGDPDRDESVATIFPGSGPATGSFTDLHAKSKFPAAQSAMVLATAGVITRPHETSQTRLEAHHVWGPLKVRRRRLPPLPHPSKPMIS